MENELVRYSRAGDVFHYRWAARRCLRLISPKSLLRNIVIEGSMENEMEGEYVIDVAEYSESLKEGNFFDIDYYQLKHTTVQKDIPFNLSDLKGTIEGFSARYLEHLNDSSLTSKFPQFTFTIITNRPINKKLKESIVNIVNVGEVDIQYRQTLEKYTKLSGVFLRDFCSCLRIEDGEGDYNVQKQKLHVEIAQLLAGSIDNAIIENVTSLVRDKALPDLNGGRIVREDILKYFGVTSEHDLYPAPPEVEKLDAMIYRQQYGSLLNSIIHADKPVIIHAPGGVGKTAFASYIVNSLPAGSVGIVYDCFGGGGYRNRSKLRHRHREALVQIANELALQGICDPLLVNSTSSEDDIFRKFLERITTAITSLKNANSDAILVLLVDAADNAEMAAMEFGDKCFAHELLREEVTEGVKIVALCRTERIHLLQPSSYVLEIELKPFSEEESYNFLLSKFDKASPEDGLEFHRLTNGNPRVQANALGFGKKTLSELFETFGAIGTSVEEQIRSQLKSAVSVIKDKLAVNYQKQVESICVGLATLPPFIPLKILSRAADVEESTIKSFVADIGRSMWLTDDSVQFRDEPTETWFRETYAAKEEQIRFYIDRLKPLANEYTYVASTMPSLLLQAGKYSELVGMALSDQYLPSNNPIDERNVRVFRLQFAFKAALNQGNFVDAIKLALRAGEEVAGDKRQYELLTKNIDLLAPLLDDNRVQEFAFRRVFNSAWKGSENVFSASLLSTVKHFKGEARSYLRAAHNWLKIYFEERKKQKEDQRYHYHEKLEYDDIAELVYAHLNLEGPLMAVKYLLSWQPNSVIYQVSRKLFKRLVDAGNFKLVNEIAIEGTKSQYLIIAMAHELLEVGHIPSVEILETSLDLLITKRTRIKKLHNTFQDTTLQSLIAFLESCAARGLAKEKILRVLRHYYPERARQSISSNYQNDDREVYLRALALKSVLSGKTELDFDKLLPEDVGKDKKYVDDQETKEIKEVISGLIPWYHVRVRSLIGCMTGFLKEIENADRCSKSALSRRWRSFDSLPAEIAKIRSDILIFHKFNDGSNAKFFYENYVHKDNNLVISSRFKLVRSAFRLDHLDKMKRDLEEYAYNSIQLASNEGPETKANWYISLARALVNADHEDAAVYFNLAIEAVSKFGDELVERWDAVVSLANRREVGEQTAYEIAYRFIRCAELIGENVASEKYWDRDEAVRTCVRLSPTTALAALSRWRDREIGRFSRQLSALAEEIVSGGYISPKIAWSLSPFLDEYELGELLLICIEKEQSHNNRQYILDSGIKEFRTNAVEGKIWDKINEAALNYSLQNAKLDEVMVSNLINKKKSTSTSTQAQSQEFAAQLKDQQEETVNWNLLLDGLELNSADGIRKALVHYDSIPSEARNSESFWQEIISHIYDSDVNKFLHGLVSAENADLYDIRSALLHLPDTWLRKVSVKNEWPKIIELIGRRFASILIERGMISYFTRELPMEESKNVSRIQKGIIEGLSTQGEMVSASTFFGFVKIASKYISTNEATNLLDYALSRFEMHIDNDFADGPWSESLLPPDSIKSAFAGFIWSALGSPRRSTRWNAAHCVRRLSDAQAVGEINSLIDWMERDVVGSCGASKFPFYNLYARQYLLIALSRVSINNPHILVHHSDVFYRHSLCSSPHILIQKYAAEIAQNIEKAYPDTYPKEIIEKLQKVGASQFAKLEMENRWEAIDSYWHANGKVDSNISYHHGYDFNSYWFEPLGKVFGISEEQVEDLATEVVINEWGIADDGGYEKDPRHVLWRSSDEQQQVYSSHGSYPRIDDYSFYLSLHAMFVVAGKLLEKMPVVHSSDWYEDEWGEWLSRHILTRRDGFWLYDRRDPVPLTRRDWIYGEKSSSWRSEIFLNDFLDGLITNQDGQPWLNVYGSWEDGDGYRTESYTISSALVSNDGAQALLSALSTCSNPHDFKIPHYKEDKMEFTEAPLTLKGWIYQEDVYKRIDEYDPHSAKLDYPPYIIGESVMEKMMLTTDYEKRKWTLLDAETVLVICELWGTKYDSKEDDSIRSGNRLVASLSFLQKLCIEFQSELIFEVQINRRFRQKSYMRSEETDGYKPPLSKIFVLSADGRLRDTETYYEFRQIFSQ